MQGIAINAKGLTENIRSIVKGIEAADSNKLKVCIFEALRYLKIEL